MARDTRWLHLRLRAYLAFNLEYTHPLSIQGQLSAPQASGASLPQAQAQAPPPPPRILRFPWQLVREQVRQTVAEALQVWSEVTPLTFTEVHEGHADIMIDFNRYWHGDNLPFDGPGGILAHAFFPKTHREGDVHFDYDETWTIGDNQDDRRGIQHLYGQPRRASTSQASALGPRPGIDTNEIAPVEPEVPPDACEASFDAVSTIRGELFFFKAGFVWRLRSGRLQPGYPALASRHWQGLPSPVDAAFEDAQGHIWFFQDGTGYLVSGCFHPPCMKRDTYHHHHHHHHPVRRGPQIQHAALPSSLTPALATQEAFPPANSPRPPRCGVPDPPDGLNARNRQKRFVLSGGRWEKTDLTYR
ncbi:Hypothetical predicted protein [Marmota monax]|uniref:Peptidase metallopeptidase domain-containing protein n=1 Tax=Marmota monax TaxID=9995 RepID=A0A5E4C4H7_MARMO|nr:Hypothetical predicted protein [Marmota monax]